MPVHAGITFREVMQGAFALGATDPAHGQREGARTPLVLEATVVIPSMQRFLEDAQHRGTLDGRVTFEPIGVALPARSGRFKLFTPTEDPDLKLMVYSLTFERGSEAYCLSGTKHVRRRSILHSWADTTTLLCRLHRGADEGAPVVGAGVLRLSAPAFAKQLLSVSTVNARRPSEKARALGAFFTFFAGELVDTYVSSRAR